METLSNSKLIEDQRVKLANNLSLQDDTLLSRASIKKETEL
jgi:hypothetical protein